MNLFALLIVITSLMLSVTKLLYEVASLKIKLKMNNFKETMNFFSIVIFAIWILKVIVISLKDILQKIFSCILKIHFFLQEYNQSLRQKDLLQILQALLSYFHYFRN
jgi:hypothetical protein